MRSQIRASETTAIAFLTGNAPVIRVARNAATSGTGFDPASAAQNARFARIARAIWHSIDGQSPTPIQAEAAQQIIRQGELIVQYGWLSEADRTILPDADPAADGAALGAGGSGSAGTSFIEHGGRRTARICRTAAPRTRSRTPRCARRWCPGARARRIRSRSSDSG
jgi:hypothetical protein